MMGKRAIRALLGALIASIALLVYNSVYLKPLNALEPDEVHSAWIEALRGQDASTAEALFIKQGRTYPFGPNYKQPIALYIDEFLQMQAQFEKGQLSDDTSLNGSLDHVDMLPMQNGRWPYLRVGESRWWFKSKLGVTHRPICFHTVLFETAEGWKVARWKMGNCGEAPM